ncbi:MAG: polysaccharide deacetylase family protein [Clostridia bacterium]
MKKNLLSILISTAIITIIALIIEYGFLYSQSSYLNKNSNSNNTINDINTHNSTILKDEIIINPLDNLDKSNESKKNQDINYSDDINNTNESNKSDNINESNKSNNIYEIIINDLSNCKKFNTAIYSKSNSRVNTNEKRSLLSIMYHSINKSGLNNYVLHPNTLESDLKWLADNNYTSVFAREIVAFTEGRNDKFPIKPILITFDDGFYNNFVYAMPILKKYKCKATIAIVGKFCDNEKGQEQSVNYSNLNWTQIYEMEKSGLIEFANHTYDLHSSKKGRQGANKKVSESFSEYRNILMSDLSKTQKKLFDATSKLPICFSYPYGKYSPYSNTVIKEMGFKIALTCNEQQTMLYIGCNLMQIGRYNRYSSASSETFFRNILKQRNN